MPEGGGESSVRKHHSMAPMLVFGTAATAIGIWIVLAIHWFPTDASQQAKRIRILYDVLLIASVPIFVLVITVIGFSVYWYRMRPGEELTDGPPIHGNTRLEVIWTIAPAILIVGLCAYSVSVLYANEANKKSALTVNVTARQWAFEFAYPQPGGKAVYSPFLYLPNGRPVVFKIRSLDVIHSFFVPQFSEKLDAVPGIVTTLRVTPTKRGAFPVECTELCGAGHAFMRASTYVLTQAKFAAWMQKQPLQKQTPTFIPPGTVTPVAVPGVPTGLPAGVTEPAPPSSASATATTSTPANTPSPGASTPTTPAKTSTTPTKKGSTPAHPTATAPKAGGGAAPSAAAGKALFLSSGCAGCHTLAAAASTGTIGPNLTTRLASDCATPASKKVRGTTLKACIDKAIIDPYAYLPTGYSAGIMPTGFLKTLGAAKVDELVNFLASVTK
ncbi:MAG TPA: cytochrome c oxidase subunit II [Solirubrobacteraceae bacterium]|nr:cytochrome c oxidase subunit II [Solirubrobacteraceae bacterium]